VALHRKQILCWLFTRMLLVPGAISLELFELVPGRDGQVNDPLCRIDVGPPRHALDLCTELPNRLSLPDSPRLGVPERLLRTHAAIITGYVINVKRY